jgi:hypothetical protein
MLKENNLHPSTVGTHNSFTNVKQLSLEYCAHVSNTHSDPSSVIQPEAHSPLSIGLGRLGHGCSAHTPIHRLYYI